MYLHKSKKPNGKIYYQIAENYREGKKVKRRILKHLGPAEKFLAMNTQHINSVGVHLENTSNLEYGASFTLNEICNELNIENHIDKFVKKQPELLNLGKTMKIASIHRCISPKGFNNISTWCEGTILSKIDNINPKTICKQNLNNWLDNFDEQTVDKIQTEIAKSTIMSANPDLSRIIIDFTNVDTYQKLRNENQLSQRGKSKSGNRRTHQINYALICSNDGIPLHHNIYDGNINDPEYFKTFSNNVLEKYGSFFKQKENLIFIFDTGMNSKKAILPIDKDYKFVGSLKVSECKDICKDIREYKLVSKDKDGNEIKSYEFKITKYNQQFRGIASYHEKTAKLIKCGYDDKIRKVKAKLKEIENKLNCPKWRNKEEVETRINNCLKKYKLTTLFDVEIGTKEEKLYFKKYNFNKEKFKDVQKSWGLSYLFTNLKRMDPKKIIDIYFREKNTIEECNEMLKDVEFCRVGPVRCWIDEHIRAHFLRCTIALTIGKILAKRVNKKMKQKWKPSTIIEKLKRLDIVISTIMPFDKKDVVLSNCTGESKMLFQALNLISSFKKLKKDLN